MAKRMKMMRSQSATVKYAEITAFETIPLAVDLDGTLIKSDVLWESFVALLKRNILFIFVWPVWLIKGKAHLKREIARRVTLDAASLPYNEEFLAFLREEHSCGRRLILITASDETLAQGIADHLGVFAEVIASDGKQNMKGSAKAQVLQEKFGNRGFDYAGNERADLEVWAHARAAVVVNAPDSIVQETEQVTAVNKIFSGNETALLKAVLRAIRVKHWVKNALVFVPLLTAHQLANPALLPKSIYAFVAFSLMASSVYLFNDLIDLNHDRYHHQKRHRPFASGELSLLAALIMIPALFLGAILVALLLPLGFLLTVLSYYALNIAYSLFLKQALLVDVISLATFYAARVFAGGIATGLIPSEWLLAFSVFIFLSLAFAKRVSELQFLRHNNKDRARGRGYFADDLGPLASLGATSGYMAVLVFALYINSAEVHQLYRYPRALWLVCPLLLYWVSRLWLLVNRQQIPEDPIVFVLRDSVSCVIAFTLAVALLLAN